MKKFIKENLFKIIISFSILLIALSVGNYYLFYLPNKNANILIKENIEKYQKEQEEKVTVETSRANDLFLKKQHCQESKNEIEKEINDYNTSGVNATKFLDEIFYSPVKNTCIYTTTTWTPKDIFKEPITFIEHEAIDALTGKNILSALIDISSEQGAKRANKEADFNNAVKKLVE